MTASDYPLGFSIAGRTIFAKKLDIVHWPAFGRAAFSDFHRALPGAEEREIDGYLVHSVELNDEPDPVSRRAGYLLYVLDRFPRYITRFEGSFEEFLETKSSKTRSTLRRKVRKFARLDEDGKIDWREYRTPGEIEAFFEQALPLARRTYQAKLFDGALPDTDGFRRDAIELARQGRLRAYLLFLQGRPVAYLFTPLENGAYVYAYLGHDQDVADYSPGTVLQYLVHEKLFADKSAEKFDFTEGDGPHKALFATESTLCCNVLYLEDTLANRMLVGAHYRWNRAVEAIKRWAEKRGVQAKLKKLLR